MKKNLLITSAILASILFTGCATILGGGNSQTISLNSSKAMKGTMTFSDGSGQQHFTTPATLSVERKSKDIILTSRDGEFNKSIVKSNINGWFFGNLISGGLVGSTTDMVGGAAWKYDEAVHLSEK